jgi:hypothetical protein
VDTVSTISVSDLQQLQGLITDAIKKSSEESNTNGQDFPDEPMMDVDNAADSDEESVIEPTRPILWTSRPEPDQEDIPRYMQDGPVESAPQQPTRPTISQQERSLSVPHETAKPTSKGRSKSVTLDSPRETRRGVSPRSKRLSP